MSFMSFQTDSYLSTIAVQNPRSIPVFKKYGLDFCCGGARPLAEACNELNLNAADILREIQGTNSSSDSSSREAPETWLNQPAEKLIEHILEAFHEKHRHDLAYLIPLAQKVETTHANNAAVPRGIHELLKTVASALEEHMAKEENILFPWIINDGPTPPYGPVQVMMHEHLGHKEKLIQLRETCHDFKLPEEACASWRALYNGVEQFIGDVMEHIHLENNVLFPMALQTT